MAKKYDITITNGSGTEAILNGTYSVSAASTGYDGTTIDPSQVTVNAETDTYEFKIAASGTLTLHVTEDGTSTGTPVEGAVFYRCDSTGNTYGDSITSGTDGNAVFNYVPYDSTNAPTIYFKQTESDGSHEFDSTLKEISLSTETYTNEIINIAAQIKTITLKDANYDGLNIESAIVTLNEVI